jgi:hypothetical protein
MKFSPISKGERSDGAANAHCGTSPLGPSCHENRRHGVQVACFSAGFQRRDPWAFVFFVLLQFHVGIRVTLITGARTGFFDPVKAMIAIRRGAAMTVDLNSGWDYWPVMSAQVDELRRRYNILPADAFFTVRPPNQLAGSQA